MTPEQIQEYHIKWSNNYKEEADFGIRVSFLLEAASKELGIKVTDEDIKASIAEKAAQNNFDPKAIEEFYSAADKRNMLACLLYTSPSPRDRTRSRMPSSA